MSATLDVAPEVLVRNILREDWTPGNVAAMVLGTDVEIHHGWLNVDYDLPEITISTPEESPIRGGETGYSGFKPDGTGPTQDIDGTLEVNCWATRNRLENASNATTTNPRQAIFLMREEVKRIIQDHYDGTDEDGNDTDIRRLSYAGSNRIVETPEDADVDVMYRYRVVAGYGYHSR